MRKVVKSVILLACCLAVAPAMAQAPSGGAIRRASHAQSIQGLHQGHIQQVGYHQGGCCGESPSCVGCGGCVSCCGCQPCFPLVRGLLRGVGCVVNRLFCCPNPCGRPVCGPNSCGYDALPWDSGGCADCAHGGSGMHYGPSRSHEMMPSPTPANPFQDDPLPTSPSSYIRPVSRTSGCTTCGVTQARAKSAPPRQIAPSESSRRTVSQAAFQGEAEPALSPTPTNRPASSRANNYRR